MSELTPLVEEHRLIRATVGVMSSLIENSRQDRHHSPEPFLQFHAFIRRWADEAHHAKEEHVLFKALVDSAGAGGDLSPLDRLVREHDFARTLADAIGSAAAACQSGHWRYQPQMVEATIAYCRLARSHMQYEDQVLYPLARKRLGAAGIEALSAQFEAVDLGTRDQFRRASERVIASARAAFEAHEQRHHASGAHL